MVRPGVTTRKPRVKFRLVGRLTALTVCQAMSIAITVVLPAPVASLSASRARSGFACSIHVVEPLENLAHLAAATLRRDLGQPDRRLDGLDLAEERADVAEVVLTPVLQQARRLRRDIPLRLGRGAPDVYLPSQHVDGRRRVVLLLFGGEPLPFVDDHRCLLSPAALLPWARHGRDVGRRASLFEDTVRGLALVVEIPVARRVLVRRVENRGFEEAVRHGFSLSVGGA